MKDNSIKAVEINNEQHGYKFDFVTIAVMYNASRKTDFSVTDDTTKNVFFSTIFCMHDFKLRF